MTTEMTTEIRRHRWMGRQGRGLSMAALLIGCGMHGPAQADPSLSEPPQRLPVGGFWCPAGTESPQPADSRGDQPPPQALSAAGRQPAPAPVPAAAADGLPPSRRPPQIAPTDGSGGWARSSSAAARIPAGCVGLEVPRTLHQYILGLQLRDPLPPLHGMWFAYRPAQVARFWMHRTPQPLDLIFVRDGRVLAIEPGAPPCMHLPCPSYGPDALVDGVLELGAGEAARLALVVGSPLRVSLLTPAGPEAPAPD